MGMLPQRLNNWLSFRHIFSGIIASALVSYIIPPLIILISGFFTGIAIFLGSDLITALLLGLFILSCSSTIALFYFVKVYIRLKKWKNIEHDTDLVGFSPRNKDSDYHPKKIWSRDDLVSLDVLANGCSKWTREIADSILLDSVQKIVGRDGKIRFIASSPEFLAKMATDQTFLNLHEHHGIDRDWLNRKARSNASSLNKLLRLKRELGASDDCFDIKTYQHLATLRVIVVNGDECILGHYQKSAAGDSNYSPLLLFRNDRSTEWGFGSGFKRLFDDQWKISERISLQSEKVFRKMEDTEREEK